MTASASDLEHASDLERATRVETQEGGYAEAHLSAARGFTTTIPAVSGCWSTTSAASPATV
jgi:hypothetical protein